jgi:hypothetical protein
MKTTLYGGALPPRQTLRKETRCKSSIEDGSENWIKLNNDDTCMYISHIVGCGDLFRDSDGRWTKGLH